ncbi:hypothetical protein DOT_0398 [Desulfosporosinus sp. OT]|nr:hypothetical protein DOT_0398 [Desulfosporosinus sp. OT]
MPFYINVIHIHGFHIWKVMQQSDEAKNHLHEIPFKLKI